MRVPFSFCKLCSTMVGLIEYLCERSSTIAVFVSSQIWKRHAVLPNISAENLTMKISECLGGKILVSLTVITKVQQLRNLTLIVQIRNPKFVGEIKTMIDNDPSK